MRLTKRTSTQSLEAQDALSLDDLDKVVGGSGDSLPSQEQHYSETPSHEGGYQPPQVTAPAHLPDPIQQIETQVSNHSISGDQAVTQIADIIGHQPDHGMQGMAGAEIASLIGRGLIDEHSAITDLHNAVTQSHSLTGEQAVGVLAGMMAAQSITAGESATISTAAHGEIAALVTGGQLDADHAITVIAGIAGTQTGGFTLVNEMHTIATDHGVSPASLAHDISAAVDSHDLTGTQAVSLLIGTASQFGGADLMHAAGHEIADLVAHRGVSVADAMAGINGMTWSGEGVIIPILAAAGAENHDLLAPAGAEIAVMLARDPFFYSFAENQFNTQVANGSLPLDAAITMLLGCAAGDPAHGINGQSGWASQMAVDLIEQRHFSTSDVMTDIQNAVTAGVSGDAAVGLLLGIATNGGYGASLAPAADATLVQMLNNGQIDPTHATNMVAQTLQSYASSAFYSGQAMQVLLSIGESTAPGAESAVTGALQNLLTSGAFDGAHLISLMASQVGANTAAGVNTAFDTAILREVADLVTAGAVGADTAITALADAGATTFRVFGRPEIAAEIESIAAASNLSATQVMADVMAGNAVSSNAWGVMGMLSFLSGGGPDYQAAAASSLLSLVDGVHFGDGGSIVSGLGTLVLYEGLPVDTGVSLMAALVGSGTTAVHADVAASQIASFITAGKIGAAQAMVDIHASVVSGVLGGDAALALLANISANATTARIAVNNEMLALVTGTSPLIPPGHASEVLTALQASANAAGNTALAGVITTELSVLAASDPAEAVFQGLTAISSDLDLDGAATQLATMMQSGATSIATVMNDIDHAFATGALTAPQAATLLADIAVHGNMAAQVAAGAEFAAIVSAAGTGIQSIPGSANFALYQEVLGVIGVAMGGTVFGTMPTTHASTLNTEGAIAFLMGAIGAQGNSDANRQVFQTALSAMWQSGFQSSTVYFPVGQEPATHFSLVPTLDNMLAAHAVSGANLIHTAVLVNWLLPANYLPNLIANQSLSMADVHGAITAGYWAVDDAAKVLASLSSMPTVMAEIDTLLDAGTLTAGQLIADSRDASVADAEYVRILDKFAASSDANTQHLVSAELANEIMHGPRSAGVVQSILNDAGSHRADLVDQMLGQLSTVSVMDAGHLLGRMVTGNITTFDHVITLLAGQTNTLVNAVQWAVIQSDLGSGQVMNAFMTAAGNGELSADQVKSIAVGMADTADTTTMATTAGAMLASAVSHGVLSAQDAMSALTNNANRYAHVLQGAAPGIGVPQMTAVLNSFVAHCNPADVGAACQEVMTLVSYNFMTADSGAQVLIGFAESATAASLNQIGGFFSWEISQGQQSLSTVVTLINQSIAGGSLTGPHAMAIYAGLAEGSTGQVASGALGQITALMQGGHGTAQDAFAALAGVAGSMAANNNPSLVQLVGDQLNAIAATHPEALAGFGDAITGGTLTGAQAAAMLLGMTHNWSIPAGVVAEIDALVNANLMTPTQFMQALNNSVTSTALSPDGAIAILANCWPGAGTAFEAQAAGMIVTMIQAGQINATQALYDINATINHPLTVDQAVGMMTAICTPNNATISDAVAANLTQILNIGTSVMSLDQVVAGIDHAVTSGAASAENAVTLLTKLAPMSTEATAAAAQEIVGLIANNEIQASTAVSYVTWAAGGTADHGITFLIDIAANSTAATQLAFGSYVANLVGQGTITADQAVGYVRDAYAAQLNNPVHAPFTPGFVTAAQELKLLANMLGGMASPGHLDATSLIAPVHAELLAAMHTPPTRATDTEVVAALQEAGLSGGPILAAANAEITRLEADPKVLIDVAAQTGLDMGNVGSQLATLISQGTLSVGEAMGDILAANTAHNLSNDQALTMVVSTVAHAASAGIYLQAQTGAYANNWLLATASTLEHLAQNGLSSDSIGAAFHSMIGQAPGMLSPGDAVAVLASTAAYADMQGMAATQLAEILTNPNFYETPNQLAYDVARFVSGPAVPGGLSADAAVQLLAHVAATVDTPATYGGIALGLGQQASPAHIMPDNVANAVTAMVQAHTLGGEQALHFLAPYGANAPGTIGHAIGGLIASNQVSMADFTALIAGGVLQDSDQIQNTSYWQQVAGTGSVMFDTAVVMLAAMTSQTDAAVTQLAQIVAADNSFVGSTIASRILDAGTHPDTSGLNPREAVRALTILAADHSQPLTGGSNFLGTLIDDIGQVVNAATAPGISAQNYMTYGDAVAEVAALSVNGNAAVAQAGMTVLNALVGQTGVYGNDGIVSAVGHGLTADQAVKILTDLSVTQTVNMQQHVRADIAYLIDHGQITAAQAFADVHAESLARGLSPIQEFTIYAGVVGGNGPNAALESAAADAILAMVSGGRMSLGQVMDGLAQATVTSSYITYAQSQDIYLTGGLSIGNSAALIATIAAHSTDPAAFGLAAAELAAMVGGYPAADRPAVMGGVDIAVSSGLLSPAQAVDLLASAPLGASDDARAAFGGEFVALISNGHVTVDQAVSAIEAMAHNGTPMQQLQAGVAIGLLVAQNQLSAADAIGGVTAAIASNALAPAQAVGVLAGMSAGGSDAMSNAAAAEIVSLINSGADTGAHALSLLVGVAVTGTGSMTSGIAIAIDALMEGHAVTAAQAMQSIETAWGSGAIPTPAGMSLLVDIGRTTDAALQVAVGHEIGAIIQACNAPNAAIATLGQQLAANVSQDQAVVLLAAAIAGAGATTQTPLAALVVTMTNTGPIGVAQVLSDIDAAVASHALPAAQALVALAHLEEAFPNASRVAVVNEATALVGNGLVPAADAAQTLLGAAHGGSTALQSLIGGMLGSLADHSLLTGQQIVAAITGASTISNTEALGVLMGMGVNGNAAAQEVSGAGILSMIQSGRIDPQTVIDLIDYQSTHNGITPEHGLQVLLNVMGAAIGEFNAGATGVTGGYDKIIRDQMIGEVVHLVQIAQFYGGGAHATLLEAAGHSMALAEAVGRCCTFLGTNAAILSGGELAAAVSAGRMTADEGMMVALTSSMSLQAQGQWTFINFVQASGLPIDQVIHFLAVTAARTGDSDPTNPNLAYTGSLATDLEMMNAAFADMVALAHGIAGVPPQTTSATVFNDILSAVGSHDLTGMQSASMLAVLAGKLGGGDVVLAANAIGSLVTQHLIGNADALHTISWAVGAGLAPDLAKTMYAAMALSADPDVRQIAFWHFNATNLGSETLAHALHAVTTNALFTHDQALTILCNVAPGILDGSRFPPDVVAATLAAEITSMVTSHQITADHALAMLAGFASGGGFNLDALGAEVAALVTAGAVTLDRALTDLGQGGLNTDQLVTVLGRMSALDHGWDSQIVSRISAMLDAGQITAVQAMADLGAVHNQIVQGAQSQGRYSSGFALELLNAFVNANPALEAAAAAECATLIGQGTLSNYGLVNYALAHFDQVHAYGWIVSVAAYGNSDVQSYVDTQLSRTFGSHTSDLTNYLTAFLALGCVPRVQFYIGQELGRLVDHSTPVQATAIIDTIDMHVSGTTLANEMLKDATQGAKNMHISVDSLLPTKLSSDVAAMVLLGLSSSTHNSEVASRTNQDQTLVGRSVDAQFIANVAQALPPEQALAQFANMAQNGWASTALVAKGVADMVAAGTVTVQQVITAMGTMDTNHALALVTDILALHEAGSSAFSSQFATLTLLTWGVAPTSQTYTQLHDAISQAVPDFVGLVRGTTTAQQAITDVRAIAASHNISADLLLMATYQAAAQDPAIGAASLGGALTTIGHEIYTHLTDGTAAHAVANMVVGGAMSESAAATLMQELSACATIPPNAIMSQVASGNMSVWYADAHHPGWGSNADALQFTETQSVAMMHVDVHVAQDAAAVLAGTMTAQAAIDDVLAVGSASEYAKDLGLLGLAHELAGASQTAQDTVGLALTARLASGAAESTLVTMASHGWLSAQSAVDMLENEVRVATAGVTPDAAAMFEAVALARLDLAASGQTDPNATVAQQQLHHHDTSSAIQNLLESTNAVRVLQGLGALQTLGNDTYMHGAELALAQHMMGVVVTQLMDQEAATPGSTGASSSTPDWAHSLPPAVQQTMHYADIATQIFTFGIGGAALLNTIGEKYAPVAIVNVAEHPVSTVVGLAPSLLELAVAKYAPATDIAALTRNPASVQTWVDLGVDVTVSGVPGAGALGLPSWAGGLQANLLNEALGEGASTTFLAANIGSKAALAALEMGVVKGWLDDHPAVGFIAGTLRTELGLVSESCSLISGMISGTIHTAANMYLAAGTATFETFKDIFTGHNASDDAAQLGKTIFVLMTGASFDSVATVGEDVGNAMVDIFSGHPQELGSDLSALGKDSLHMIASNPFLQMASQQAYTYLQRVDDYLGNPSHAYTSDGLKGFLGLPTSVSWDEMMSTTFSHVGNVIADGVTDAGNTIADGFKHTFHI